MGLAELDMGLAELDMGLAELDMGCRRIESARSAPENAMHGSQISEINIGPVELDMGFAELDMGLAEYREASHRRREPNSFLISYPEHLWLVAVGLSSMITVRLVQRGLVFMLSM